MQKRTRYVGGNPKNGLLPHLIRKMTRDRLRARRIAQLRSKERRKLGIEPKKRGRKKREVPLSPVYLHGIRAAGNAKARAIRLGIICTCCTFKQIQAIYIRSARKGNCEVDHIIPMIAGGKHCRKNLQILTVEQHKKKTLEQRSIMRKLWLLAIKSAFQ
jgi:hypothetical protein